MTALVGVLNKRGVAIAADSGLTLVGNGPIEVAIITKTEGFKWIKHYNLA